MGVTFQEETFKVQTVQSATQSSWLFQFVKRLGFAKDDRQAAVFLGVLAAIALCAAVAIVLLSTEQTVPVIPVDVNRL
jgi:uncharacterized membrane protein